MLYFCVRCGVAIKPWGRRSCCPPCAIIKYKISREAWYERNREKIRAQRAQFRKLNKAKLAATNATYHKENSERIREYQRGYRKQNKEKISIRDRAYHQKNRERLNKKMRDYIKLNPHIARSINARRRALKKSGSSTFPYKGYEKDLRAVAMEYGLCPLCKTTPTQWHLEHATPLSRGGKHEIGNLYYCCSTCNVRKCTKTLEEFNGMSIKDIPYNIYLTPLGRKNTGVHQVDKPNLTNTKTTSSNTPV